MSRLTELLEHCVMGAVVLATLCWLELVPTAVLGQAAMALALWSAFSTVLVALLGAWVALGRRRHPRPELVRGN